MAPLVHLLQLCSSTSSCFLLVLQILQLSYLIKFSFSLSVTAAVRQALSTGVQHHFINFRRKAVADSRWSVNCTKPNLQRHQHAERNCHEFVVLATGSLLVPRIPHIRVARSQLHGVVLHAF
ncbi:TPA: hypothetical protein ACH3X1_013893 [Trebouxia sp. C0004]